MNFKFLLKRLIRESLEEWRTTTCLLTIPLIWGAGKTFDVLQDTWLTPLLDTTVPTRLWHVLCGTLLISAFAFYHRRYIKKISLLLYNSLEKTDRDFLHKLKKGDIHKSMISSDEMFSPIALEEMGISYEKNGCWVLRVGFRMMIQNDTEKNIPPNH